MASGIRWAETTSAWYATPNSSHAPAAGCITGQSESEPITMPTRAAVSSDIRFSHQVGSGMPCPVPDLLQIIAGRGHMPHLPTGPDLFAVELHPQPLVPGTAVQQGRRQIAHRPTEHVAHHRPGVPLTGVAKRQVQHGPEMVLEL